MKRKIIITILILLIISIGIGYAYLETDLSINSSVHLKKIPEYMYFINDIRTKTIPDRSYGYVLDESKSNCSNDVKISWDYNKWSPVKSDTGKESSCKLYFKDTSSKTISDIRLNVNYIINISNNKNTAGNYILKLNKSNNTGNITYKITDLDSGEVNTKTSSENNFEIYNVELDGKKSKKLSIVVSSDNISDQSMVSIECNKNVNIGPSIILSSETYLEGWNGWNLDCANVDGDFVTLEGDDSCTIYNSYIANNNYWYVTFSYTPYTTTGYCNNTNIGTFNLNTEYFDINSNSIKSSNGYSSNGRATCIKLNSEKENFSWDGWVSMNVYKVRLKFLHSTGDGWTNSDVKLWNFKFHGTFKNNFYDVNVKTESQYGIKSLKYYKGTSDTNICLNKGTDISDNKFTVKENGIYTVCSEDNYGNTNSSNITIDNIE